jgi:hypothetical protein
MKREKIDWATHVEKYATSGLSIREYCAAAALSFSSFQTNRYKILGASKEKSSGFRKFSVGLSLQISLGDDGSVTVNGLSPEQIPAILRACNAIRKQA